MQKMKAAIYSGIEQIGIQEVERTSPQPGYVVLEMKRSGICGSDLHNYFGEWSPSQTQAQGHEVCGVVAEVGAGVENVAAGDRVALECFSHCGECVYCRTGHYNHCLRRKFFLGDGHGGFAEYTTVHASALFPLPDSVSDEAGALVEPLAVGVRAVAQARATYQDRVAVIGGGTIGLLTLAAARAAGVRETLITVKYAQQAQLAQELGADHVIDVTQTDFVETVKAQTDGLGVDVVIETVGGGSNFNAALEAVRRRGRVVLVAGYHKPLEVDLGKIVTKEPLVTGSNCYSYSDLRKDFDVTIDLIASGRIDPTRLVTHRFSLDAITDAFATAADKTSGSIKVHVQPS